MSRKTILKENFKHFPVRDFFFFVCLSILMWFTLFSFFNFFPLDSIKVMTLKQQNVSWLNCFTVNWSPDGWGVRTTKRPKYFARVKKSYENARYTAYQEAGKKISLRETCSIFVELCVKSTVTPTSPYTRTLVPASVWALLSSLIFLTQKNNWSKQAFIF